MARSSQTKMRVVLSLHLPRQQHQRFTKAAKAAKCSLAEFIRTATDARADSVLGVMADEAADVAA